MHIPEKYRERYDRLALNHPWMREMRDEQAPEGDVVAILRKWANFWGVSHSTHTQCDSNWEKTTMNAIADMIERDYVRRDEQTNGIDGETNGIADGSPLVDRDPVEIMRMAANGYEGGTGYVLKNAKSLLGMDERSTDTDLLETLADMVERDYVRREAYEDLKDEFAWMSSFLHRVGKQCGTKDVPSLKAYVEQLEAKVAEQKAEIGKYEHDCSILWDEKAKLEVERDEWKARYEEAEDAVDVYKRLRDEWKAKSTCPHDYEEGVSNGNPFVKKWVCRKCGHETLIVPAQVERDGWKAKAEQAQATIDMMQGAIDGYEGDVKELEETISTLEAERDEAIEAYDKHIEAHDAWHEPEDIQYTRNRFSVLEKAKNERIAKLESERDGLKRKLEILKAHGVEIVDAVAGGFEVYNEAIRERDEWKAKALDYEHKLNVELACSDKSIIGALESDRDAWKSKAEQAERAMNVAAGKWAKLDAEMREGSSKVRAGQSKSAERAAAAERLRGTVLAGGGAIKKLAGAIGVEWNSDNAPASMSALQNRLVYLLEDDGLRSDDGVTNLEWLYEHDRERLIGFLTGDIDSCESCFRDGEFPECGGDCVDNIRDWFMAPHDDAHSKAQSKTEPNLTEQSESLSDEADSREKLEADVEYVFFGSYPTIHGLADEYLDAHGAVHGDSMNESLRKTIVHMLDRQAAITRAECERICDTCEYPDLAEADADACDHIAALQGEVDKLTDENAKLSSDELTARTACDYWRGQFEAIRSRHRLLKEQMAAVLDES